MDAARLIVVTGATLAMIIGLVLVFLRLKAKNQGFGLNSLRALGTVLLIPTLLILATVSEFKVETLAALFGTVAGYILSRSEPEGKSAKTESASGGSKTN